MSKWEALRSVLRKGERNASSASSIHHFQGFQRISKTKCIWTGFELVLTCRDDRTATTTATAIVETCEDFFQKIDTAEFVLVVASAVLEHLPSEDKLCAQSASSSLSFELLSVRDSVEEKEKDLYEVRFKVKSAHFTPIYPVVEFYRYDLSASLSIFTRELPKNKKIKSTDLLSDKLFGVDNTGNICVWPSEPLLLHLMCTTSLKEAVRGKRVLEVGGGMTGLVGLGLAAMELCSEVLITDGHPHCVANQNVCVEMCKSKKSIRHDFPISCKQMEWSSIGVENEKRWDVIIGVDCLFFKDFHDALLQVLKALLDDNGEAIFFQPQRGGSMDLFISKAASYFDLTLESDYSPDVTREDSENRNNSSYNHDVHYPYLLRLRLKNKSTIIS